MRPGVGQPAMVSRFLRTTTTLERADNNCKPTRIQKHAPPRGIRQQYLPPSVSNNYGPSTKQELQMRLLKLIVFILLFQSVNSFAQTVEPRIDKIIFSFSGDSIITQTYELNIKNRQIYFITPFVNYLDIKGEKYKRHIRFSKSKRQQIFDRLSKIDLSSLNQFSNFRQNSKQYTLQVFYVNNVTTTYVIPFNSIPADLKEIYNALSEK